MGPIPIIAATVLPAIASHISSEISKSAATRSFDPNGGTPGPLELMQMQQQIQQESLFFTMHTNISKTEHDARMSAVRNMKA